MLFSDNLKLSTQDGSKLIYGESTIVDENDGITIPGIIYKDTKIENIYIYSKKHGGLFKFTAHKQNQ